MMGTFLREEMFQTLFLLKAVLSQLLDRLKFFFQFHVRKYKKLHVHAVYFYDKNKYEPSSAPQ